MTRQLLIEQNSTIQPNATNSQDLHEGKEDYLDFLMASDKSKLPDKIPGSDKKVRSE